MEEVADLLWVGGLAATHASAQWREAWSHLRAACEHTENEHDLAAAL